MCVCGGRVLLEELGYLQEARTVEVGPHPFFLCPPRALACAPRLCAPARAPPCLHPSPPRGRGRAPSLPHSATSPPPLQDFYANFLGDAHVKIPWVRRDLSGPKVLVMEWIDGIRCARLAARFERVRAALPCAARSALQRIRLRPRPPPPPPRPAHAHVAPWKPRATARASPSCPCPCPCTTATRSTAAAAAGRCTDVAGLKASGLDLDAFIRTGVVSGLRQLLEFGLFHGEGWVLHLYWEGTAWALRCEGTALRGAAQGACVLR
jgi:hypothetical protein